MIKARLRDFIKTEIGFFAVNTYEHPDDRIFAFLRYLNLNSVDKNIISKYGLNKNDIRYSNGNKYIKITDTTKTYDILKEYFPEYLFYDKTKDITLHAVPKEHIIDIIDPNTRLNEILENCNNKFEEKCKYIADKLHDFGINYKDMGVSGSTVVRLNNDNSDIDFVIYGMDNHKKSRNILKYIFEKYQLTSDEHTNQRCSNQQSYSQEYNIYPLSENFWKKAYYKRIKDNTLTYDEFVWHEKRKYNRGVINNTMFDLLATRHWNEINSKYGDYVYKNLGYIKIRCRVFDDNYIFDNPAIYKIKDVEILDGAYNSKNNSEIEEVVSFTHTYAGQAFNNEDIVVRGKLEEVISNIDGRTYKRVVVGTSREACNEYIKLCVY